MAHAPSGDIPSHRVKQGYRPSLMDTWDHSMFIFMPAMPHSTCVSIRTTCTRARRVCSPQAARPLLHPPGH
eukprot:4229460-Prymnesium_polylepis.1